MSVMSATIPWNSIKDLYAVQNETSETFEPIELPKELSKLHCYFDTGAIYVFSMKIILEEKSIIDASHTLAVKTNPMSFFDIDYQFHLDLANSYFFKMVGILTYNFGYSFEINVKLSYKGKIKNE